MSDNKNGLGVFTARTHFHVQHQGWNLKRSWQNLAKFWMNLDDNNPLPEEMVGEFQLKYEYELLDMDGELVETYEEGPSERGATLVYYCTTVEVDPDNGNKSNHTHIYLSREPTQEECELIDGKIMDEDMEMEWWEFD